MEEDPKVLYNKGHPSYLVSVRPPHLFRRVSACISVRANKCTMNTPPRALLSWYTQARIYHRLIAQNYNYLHIFSPFSFSSVLSCNHDVPTIILCTIIVVGVLSIFVQAFYCSALSFLHAITTIGAISLYIFPVITIVFALVPVFLIPFYNPRKFSEVLFSLLWTKQSALLLSWNILRSKWFCHKAASHLFRWYIDDVNILAIDFVYKVAVSHVVLFTSVKMFHVSSSCPF